MPFIRLTLIESYLRKSGPTLVNTACITSIIPTDTIDDNNSQGPLSKSKVYLHGRILHVTETFDEIAALIEAADKGVANNA